MNPEIERALKAMWDTGKVMLRSESERAATVAKEEAQSAARTAALAGAGALAVTVGLTGLTVALGMALLPQRPGGMAFTSSVVLLAGGALGFAALRTAPRPRRMLKETVGRDAKIVKEAVQRQVERPH